MIQNTPVSTPFNFAQTFFIDPARVAGSDTILVTSVDLYFKTLPSLSRAIATYADPGIAIYVCPVEENTPVLDQYNQLSAAYKKRSQLTASTTSLIPNKFTFSYPVALKTGRKYAVLIAIDGNETFEFWTATADDVDIVSGNRFNPDNSYVDGNFFVITNGRVLTPQRNVDLTFKLNVAKFTDLDVDYQIVNSDYEFLQVDPVTRSSTFLGGELIYKQSANQAGSVAVVKGSSSVTGNGTSFVSTYKVDDYIIVESGSSKAALRIATIASNTSLTTVDVAPFTNATAVYKHTPVAKVLDYEPLNNYMILYGSTAANAAFRFQANDTVVGVDSSATIAISNVVTHTALRYTPTHSIIKPSKTDVTITTTFANSTYYLANTNAVVVENNKQKYIDTYHAVVASRSLEVVNSTNLMANTAKSMLETVKFTSQSPYSSPAIPLNRLTFTLTEADINNDSTNEHTSFGNARSKYISQKFGLTQEQLAEDMRVYLTAYRPSGTSVEVYAKVHNPSDPDDFENKDWTKLELVSLAQNTQFSDPTNKGDTINLEFAIPQYFAGTTANGTFTVTSSSRIITGTSGTVNTNIAVGNLVRVYNPLIPDNYFISTVTASNTTTFTVVSDSVNSNTVANSSLVGTGMLVDVISTYAKSAFVDNQNFNIVRYHNSNGVPFIGYQTFAIKIVMLSENEYTIPIVYDMRALALSA